MLPAMLPLDFRERRSPLSSWRSSMEIVRFYVFVIRIAMALALLGHGRSPIVSSAPVFLKNRPKAEK